METRTSAASDQDADLKRGPIRGPQALLAGLTIVAFAAFALWAMSNLDTGSLRSMGPGMLPRSLAILIGLCGAALALFAFIRQGEGLERIGVRAPFFVAVGIIAFAFTIRQFGLIVAGPLAMIVGGFATPEARFGELIVFAAIMTALCVGLFRYLLNLPIPILIIPGFIYL